MEYLDLDSVAKVIEEFENPKSPEEKKRDGARYRPEIHGVDGMVESAKADAVEAAARRLGVEIEILETGDGLEGAASRAKGFYDTGTGKISVVLGNNESAEDATKTVLHEAVAHYGLRKLFGNGNIDALLDAAYSSADESIRGEIDALAKARGLDTRIATEEYLATLAEREDYGTRRGVFRRILDAARTALKGILRKLGVRAGELGENDLRYMLRMSYDNLTKRGGALALAEKVALERSLGVGDYAKGRKSATEIAEAEHAEETERLYRGTGEEYERALARENYDEDIRRHRYMATEAYQNSMLGLKKGMEEILKGEDGDGVKRIEDVADFENPYLGENRLSSVNKVEFDIFLRGINADMIRAVKQLAKDATERQELVGYMFAKHGLERNARMQAEADSCM